MSQGIFPSPFLEGQTAKKYVTQAPKINNSAWNATTPTFLTLGIHQHTNLDGNVSLKSLDVKKK